MLRRPSSDHPQTVRKRRVFYVPGYDPIHPRRYRELFRKEGAEQAQISGYDIEIKPKSGGTHYGWFANSKTDGAHTQAQVDVLVWSDIVRGSMSQSIPATYLQLAHTSWVYIASGALFKLMRLRKGPIIAALYPIGMLLGQLLLAILCGRILGGLGSWVTDLILPTFIALGVGWFIGILTAVFVLRWFKSKDGKFFAYYLMHDYAFSAQFNGANPPKLEARMSEFVDEIHNTLCTDVDEVLIVGHSSGAHLAVSVLSDLIRSKGVSATGPDLAFLSLGQVVPMVSFLPGATKLRADLKFLSERDEVTWIDVTAPGDGCAFALCDPVAVSGVETEGKKWPLVFSAAFTQSLSPEKWKSLRWRFFRLHFQYLCAFDRPKDYDYFQITAGPLSLWDRYHDRPQSKSRIDIAVSGHRSTS